MSDQRTTRAGRQIWCSAAEFAVMNDLPYGLWTCESGREVLFNRFYEPIRQCEPGGSPADADPQEWVPWDKQQWFYDDGTRTKRAAATRALNEWLRRHGQ